MRIFYLLLFFALASGARAQSIAELSKRAAQSKQTQQTRVSKKAQLSQKQNKQKNTATTQKNVIKRTKPATPTDPLAAYDGIGLTENGLCIASKSSGGYCVIDENGKQFVKETFSELSLAVTGSDYQSNAYIGTNSDGQYFFMNSSGYVLHTPYDNVEKLAGENLWIVLSADDGTGDQKLGFVRISDDDCAITDYPCQYDDIETYGDNCYLVTKNGQKGILDSDLHMKFSCNYEEIEPVSYNPELLIVTNSEGKKGIVTLDDETVLNCQFQEIGNFGGAKKAAWVKRDGKYGIYTIDGTPLVACYIDDAYTIEADGRHQIDFTENPPSNNTIVYLESNNKVEIMKQYAIMDNFRFDYISPAASNGLMFCRDGRKWGIANTDGKIIQYTKYDKIEVSKGVFVKENYQIPESSFTCPMRVWKDNKVGILSAKGESVSPVIYDNIFELADDTYRVQRDGKFGFINTDGSVAVAPSYSYATDFSEGLAGVKNDDGEFMFINKQGLVAIKAKDYDRIETFKNGTCRVYRKDKSWLIDREGKKVKDSTKELY